VLFVPYCRARPDLEEPGHRVVRRDSVIPTLWKLCPSDAQVGPHHNNSISGKAPAPLINNAALSYRLEHVGVARSMMMWLGGPRMMKSLICLVSIAAHPHGTFIQAVALLSEAS
jgi:hypothetical protein